eukprot:SAG11_NODE_9073_length_947_cov_0.795991_1_plen_133_part_00
MSRRSWMDDDWARHNGVPPRRDADLTCTDDLDSILAQLPNHTGYHSAAHLSDDSIDALMSQQLPDSQRPAGHAPPDPTDSTEMTLTCSCGYTADDPAAPDDPDTHEPHCMANGSQAITMRGTMFGHDSARAS